MTTAKTRNGVDVFDDITERLMAVGVPLGALIPHAGKLPCKAEFAAFVNAWGDVVKAWDAYLSAELRATLLAPETQSTH